jgi:hypothetical protein
VSGHAESGRPLPWLAVTAIRRSKPPFGLRNLRRKRRPGLYVYGWYPRLRGRPVDRRFDLVSVLVDGHSVGTCSLSKRARFVPLSRGPHHVALVGDGVELASHTVHAAVHTTVLEFWPTYNPFGPLPGRTVERFKLWNTDEAE